MLTNLRKEEHSCFATAVVELVNLVDTLDHTIRFSDRDPTAVAHIDTASKECLKVMVHANMVDAATLTESEFNHKYIAKLIALVTEGDSEEGAPADSDTTHTSSGGGIVDVLKGKREKFKAEVSELHTAEGKSKEHSMMLKQCLEARIEGFEADAAQRDCDNSNPDKRTFSQRCGRIAQYTCAPGLSVDSGSWEGDGRTQLCKARTVQAAISWAVGKPEPTEFYLED